MAWLTLGDSVIGTSHRARGTPCQDAFRHGTFGASAEWLAIAVADGAGSAAYSDRGATLACDALLRGMAKVDPGELHERERMVQLFADARAELLSEGRTHAVPPRDLACTALLALVGPDSAAFAQLGDGALVIRQGDGYHTVFWPDPAEYANATDFLTDETFRQALRFETVWDAIDEAAALTDGLQRVALDYSGRRAHAAFFRPFFEKLRNVADVESLNEPLRAFLDSPRLNERTDDDKTLVLAVRCS